MGRITPTKTGVIIEVVWEDLTKLPVQYIDSDGKLQSPGTLQTALTFAVMTLAAKRFPTLKDKIMASMAKVEVKDDKLIVTLTPNAEDL